MKKIAIQDASILIDLVKTELFNHCLSLQFQFTTTNIILEELYDEQIAEIQPHISSGKFVIIAISDDELIEIQIMGIEDNKLSEQDWSAYYYAQKNNAILLTGDKRLRKIAESKGIEVCGILWLLDQLVISQKLSHANAYDFLNKIYEVNKRLPLDEYEKRKTIWYS